MARQGSLEKPKFSIYQIAGNVEHDLFESLIVEYNDIAGFEVYYYVRDETAADLDDLYGESAYQNISYKSKQKTKVIYEVTEEPTITNGFGITSEETIQYAVMPKHTYNRDVISPLIANGEYTGDASAKSSGDYHPRPGDVIKTIWNNRAYEIVDVAEESNIFQANKAIWEFVLKPYQYSEESHFGYGAEASESEATSASQISPFDRAPTEDRDLVELMNTPISAYGDNQYIEDQSDTIYDYPDEDVDTSVYGY